MCLFSCRSIREVRHWYQSSSQRCSVWFCDIWCHKSRGNALCDWIWERWCNLNVCVCRRRVRWRVWSCTVCCRLCCASLGRRCVSCWAAWEPLCGLQKACLWRLGQRAWRQCWGPWCRWCAHSWTSTPTPPSCSSFCPACPPPTAAPPSPRTCCPTAAPLSGSSSTTTMWVHAHVATELIVPGAGLHLYRKPHYVN